LGLDFVEVPSLRSRSVGPARMGHPWPRASRGILPLGPLHETSVQPAPKSRFVVSGLSRMKIKSKINGNGNGNGIARFAPSHIGIGERY
jgi:hypothetical protein